MGADGLITNVNLVDLDSGKILPSSWLRFRAGRIEAIGQGEPPGDEPATDLAGAYLLPGLWNADVHVSWERPIPMHETPVQMTLRSLAAAQRALRKGITGIRSAGEAHYIDAELNRLFAKGEVVGPRIVAAGYYLGVTAGHLLGNPVALTLDGPVAFRNAVRDNIRNGAEAIKFGLSGGFWGPPWDDPDGLFPADDEIDAVFETAKQRGFPVMGYATGTRAAYVAASRGAVSIEHGYSLDERTVEAMAANGVIFVPTLSLSQVSAGLVHDDYEKAFAGVHPVPAETLAKARAKAEAVRKGIEMVRKAGVRVAAGSCLNPIAETLWLELGYLVRFGFTPREALVAATQTAADLTGYGAVTGSLAAGKEADLLAVGDNPLEDVGAVRDVRAVWRAGARVV